MVFSYHRAMTGFAAILTGEEVEGMESIPGFVSAEPDQPLQLRTTYTPRFLEVDKPGRSLWDMSDKGKGAIIGVIDTGINPNHVTFSDDCTNFPDNCMDPPPTKWRGCCMFKTQSCDRFTPTICNNKLIGARSVWPGTPEDKVGHGTHVASIAAGSFVAGANVLGQAKGTASGIAPKAHLAVYKDTLIRSNGHLQSSVAAVLQGFEFAMDDGVDVLSISKGYTSRVPFDQDRLLAGAFAAMYHNEILTCFAAPNDGGESSVDNDAPWVLTVGASSIDRVMRATVNLGNGMEVDGESAYQPAGSGSQMLPLVQLKGLCMDGTLDNVDVKGKIVACRAGNTNDVNKSEVVRAAGGAGLIILNHMYLGATVPSFATVIPAAHVNYEDAEKIVSYVRTTSDPTAMIIFKGTRFDSHRAPAVASFSGRGPSLLNGGIIKPDIIGPGMNIVGAWPKTVGPNGGQPSDTTYNTYSGTSMATPHLSGVAAMIKSIHPDWSHAAIRSAIMTTAHKVDRSGQPISDEFFSDQRPASVFAMGAGLVNPPAAIDPGLVYDIDRDDYIRYLCNMGFSGLEVNKITNQKVRCHSMPKLDVEQLNYPSILVNLNSSSSKTVTRVATNVGTADSVYTPRIKKMQGVDVEVSPSQLQFSGSEKTQSYSLKFTKTGNAPSSGEYSEGEIEWFSGEYVVRSPIAVQF